ncbi:MAG: hypothetical protein FJW21_13910 [Acidimicrobiia bacterium]|nr:hypothetical protein [Acidimicrobiia bacterium]
MPPTSFQILAEQVEDILDGPMRREIAATLSNRPSAHEALGGLRHLMRSHVWTAQGQSVPLTTGIAAADGTTRREGFHALNDWDGVADHVNKDIIPVDVLDFVRAARRDAPTSPLVLGLLIDYYFFHVLSLMALRIWDEEDPASALDTVGRLLDLLQGPDGSGQPFVQDAATLILIATSHYEPNESGYDLLLTRVRLLPQSHRLAIAIGHAASLGAHLRFGFLATYGRQTSEMRDDNVADYPWLHWALSEVIQALTDMTTGERASPRGLQITEALLGGLSADTTAALARDDFANRIRPLLAELRPRFEALVPTPDVYSPLAWFFNFSHNVIKGTIIDACFREDAWTVSYSDLLTGAHGGHSPLPSREALARTLMEYARRSPQRIRGELLPVIVYDVDAGRACHAATMVALPCPT